MVCMYVCMCVANLQMGKVMFTHKCILYKANPCHAQLNVYVSGLLYTKSQYVKKIAGQFLFIYFSNTCPDSYMNTLKY